jgi:hypothetical protein
MLLGSDVATLTNVLLGKGFFEQFGTLLCDGFGFTQKPESFLQLIFSQRLLCFGQVLGVDSFTELVSSGSCIDELRRTGKYKNTHNERKLFGERFIYERESAIGVPKQFC